MKDVFSQAVKMHEDHIERSLLKQSETGFSYIECKYARILSQ